MDVATASSVATRAYDVCPTVRRRRPQPCPCQADDVDAQEWDERYRSTPELWGGTNAILEPILAALPPGRVVDLACGDGRHTAWLADRGWRAHGVDFSAAAVGQARARGGSATYDVADVRTWEPAGPLGLVLVAYLHLSGAERATLLQRAVGWLAPEGHLVLLAHARENLEHGVGGPQDPSILPGVDELAVELRGTRVHRLQHVSRRSDAGEAVDVLADVSPWSSTAD